MAIVASDFTNNPHYGEKQDDSVALHVRKLNN
jgi:hypothetical protein